MKIFNKKSVPAYAFTALFGLSAVTGYANATPIAITNGDFETWTNIPNPGDSDPLVTGWSVIGTAGEFRPATPTEYNPLPANNGSIVAFTNGGGSLSQTTGATFQTGLSYTLSVDIGHRNDLAWGQGTIEIYAGTTSTIVGTTVLTDPGANSWNTQTLTLSAATIAPHVGQFIGVLLDGGVIQTNFDNVTLDAVPIPAAVWLFGSGLLGLAGYTKRRKASTPR